MGSLSVRPLCKSACLRASYIEISNIVHRRWLPRGGDARHWRSTIGVVRSSSTRVESKNDSLKEVLDQYKDTIDLLHSKSTVSNTFSRLATKAFSAKIPSYKIDTAVELHGYVGKRFDMSKKLSFTTFISANMEDSIQLVSTSQDSEQKALAHTTLKSFPINSPVVIRGRVRDKAKPKAVQVRKNEDNSATEMRGSKQSGSDETTAGENNEKLEGADATRSTTDREPFSLQEGPSKVAALTTVEIEVIHASLLNEFPKDTILTPETIFPPEQRHLQLRTDPKLRWSLKQRAKAMQICRKALDDDFLEVDTPLLFKSTPEGAREFIVPTRQKGLAYALPQSPQQYKQILMASGIRNYFQFAKCFRDEDHRADRQPEFTQLDLEMAFATRDHVIHIIEGIIRDLWSVMLGERLPSSERTGPINSGHFDRVTYHEAMSRWGSDKPDTRYGSEILTLDDLPNDLISKITSCTNPVIDAMKMHISDNATSSRRFIGAFLDSPSGADYQNNPDGAPGVFIFDSAKPLQGLQPFGYEHADDLAERLQLEDGDLVLLQARKDQPFSGGSTMLGNLRRDLHKAAVDAGYIEASKGWSMFWVTDFPLFSPTVEDEPGQGGGAGLASTHHPFTAPKTPEDVDLLLTDPTKAIGDHYDLVINGVEIGGGSRRIHNHKVQEFVLRDVLKVPSERMSDFSHLLEALRAGCPPHAGIALGFDRLIALMLGRDSVRDVIAFPKSGRGEDAMVKSPSAIGKETLETYHLKLRD